MTHELRIFKLSYYPFLTWLAMNAGWRVEAFVGETKAFDWLAADDVRIDDFVDIGFGDEAIPDGLRVDDEIRAVLALIKASGLIGADAAFESTLGKFLLE
jgi:hypothetical protein